jgi:amidohydrolase
MKKEKQQMERKYWGQGVKYLLVVMILVSLAVPAGADTAKVVAAADAAAANCQAVSQKIFELKEPGRQEFKSSQLLMEELKKLGYNVTGDLKVPDDLIEGGISKTAFRAEMNGKGPGPTVTIMVEYDALPNGHSCGHNLIATSGLLAASALAKVMPETPGRVMVIGTPDEERGSLGGGKISLLEGGHFEGTDVVLITHPGDMWSLDQRILAMKRAMFYFKGKASHAAAAPEQGISALDAVMLTFSGVEMLREHVRQDVRIHGIVIKGGEKVNVVPEFAQAEFAVRAMDTATMENVYARVVNCAKAGELGTGATLEFTPPRTSLKAPLVIPEYISLVSDTIKSLGIPESEIQNRESFGSSDLGNVGHAYPTVNLYFKIAPDGTALHSDAMRDAAGSEDGWKATVTAGKVVALTAYELLTHPDKVKSIQAKFQELKAAEGK